MTYKELEFSQSTVLNAIDAACKRLKDRYIANGYLEMYDLQVEFNNVVLSNDVTIAANEIANITGCSECEAINFIIDKAIVDDVERFAKKKRGMK